MIELLFLKELMLITSEPKEYDICHYWYFLNKMYFYWYFLYAINVMIY